ncbi:AAA family ATPase [Micromonospora sp. NPDC047527]|uniref:AAA family ATPase n=1 Tax=Micromonospora sp. NPDC047527 TaxID=3155144 RepID=UPI0033D7369B
MTAGLVGRTDELVLLTSFLDDVAGNGAALLLTGEPGVGKTALLDATAELAAAQGMRVFRGSGVEYETEISFSGLHQLVGPLTAELASLPPPMRSALEVALGFGTGPAPAEMTVLHAALSLFGEAAREQPLLLVVDDLHVLDRASRSVIGFVARRAGGRRIGVLAAVRTGTTGSSGIGLPEREILPLGETDALRLLSDQFTRLAPRALHAVAQQAQGNPLALLEFGAFAGTDDPLPGTGPARDVRALYAARVARLPSRTRELLLLAALEGSGDIWVLEAASGPEGLDGFDAAERDDLIIAAADARTLRFRHPLVRSAVVEAATLDQRRSAHQRLADALVDQPERRADHLSMTTAAPDESIAQIVEDSAHSSMRRGDVLGAVARLRRAAALSSDRVAGSRRLAHAAYIGASVAGHLALSHQIMAELRAKTPTDRSLPAAAAAGWLCLMDGDVVTAHRLLVDAIERNTVDSCPNLDELTPPLLTLTLVCQYSGRADYWVPLRKLVATLPDVPASSPISLVRILEDPGSIPDALLRDLDEGLAQLDEVTDADVINRIALAASNLDRLACWRKPLARVVADARDTGTLGGALPVMIMSALADLYAGHWDDSQTTADEIREVGHETGHHIFGHVGDYIAGLIAAHRGDSHACQAHCTALLDWAASRGLGRLEHWAHHALARAALGSSDFESAFVHASAITVPGVLSPFSIEALWSALDLTEAALYSGRAEDALRHAAAMRDAQVSRISPRFALLTAAMTAMTSAPEDAPALFEEALALAGIDQWPFEVARVNLAYGERLRRLGHSREARVQLSTARQSFERLGAAPWTARATAELRATGMTRVPRGHTGVGLTPQELEVARLAASGLSNPQIAARLVLSPRTVSTHLYRVFPKLGITSRAALRDALAECAEGQEAGDQPD